MKESNFAVIITTKEFETIDQSLMVEIIRRKTFPTPHRPVQEIAFDILKGFKFLLFIPHKFSDYQRLQELYSYSYICKI